MSLFETAQAPQTQISVGYHNVPHPAVCWKLRKGLCHQTFPICKLRPLYGALAKPLRCYIKGIFLLIKILQGNS